MPFSVQPGPTSSCLLTQGTVPPGTTEGQGPFWPGKVGVHPQPSRWCRPAWCLTLTPQCSNNGPIFSGSVRGAAGTRGRRAEACLSLRINWMISLPWSFPLSSCVGAGEVGSCWAGGHKLQSRALVSNLCSPRFPILQLWKVRLSVVKSTGLGVRRAWATSSFRSGYC